MFHTENNTKYPDNRLNKSGFTLIELLVSIILICLIVTIMGMAMRVGHRSMGKGEEKTIALERFKASLSLIDAQIQSGIPLKSTADEINQFIFEGKRDSLTFVSNYSLIGGQRGYVNVAYRVETGADNKKMLFARENTMGVENQKDIKLLDGFEDIHFEYFFKEATAEQGAWVEEWTDTVSLPGKIRIHLKRGSQTIALIVPARTNILINPSTMNVSFFPSEKRGIFS